MKRSINSIFVKAVFAVIVVTAAAAPASALGSGAFSNTGSVITEKTDFALSGIVRSSFGLPLSNATVIATDGQDRMFYARSNQMGYFRIGGLQAETVYHLEIRHKSSIFGASLFETGFGGSFIELRAHGFGVKGSR